jgi:hypothetical protein
MQFPVNAGLIFLKDKLTDIWLILEQLERRSLQPKFQPIWSRSQRGRWAAYPLLGHYSENCAISRQAFHIQFFASRCC